MLASQAAAAVGGRLVGPDVTFDGASFDTRTLRPGELFVPIVADRDGHDFIADALAAGASCYLTSRPDPYRRSATAIEVADTAAALLTLAQSARRGFAGEVVAVTGSVGKTSTKDLIAAAVGAERRVTANLRSFNNEQGLPVTILGAPDDTEVLVVEMGMRGFGEISRLCEVGRPTIGVVTAVGSAHTERLGGIDGVARAKRELVEALPARGIAILNADDEHVVAMAAHTGASVVTYGQRGDVRITSVALDNLGRGRFRLESPWGDVDVTLAVSGRHMVSNAAAAVAVAGVLGGELESAAAALATGAVSPMRMEVVTAASGLVVVNDAYNANPTSMVAALDTLAAMDATRRVAVLGLMAELDDPDTAHREVAEYAAGLGVELIAVGTSRYGVEPVADVATALGHAGSGTVVLVKASRAAALERIVAELV